MIGADIKEQIRSRIELADLVAGYLPLRKAGTSLLARCPFHDEKTASFHVSRSKGVFYCFGCKASGDVFDFVQRMEGVSFPEALRMLGERVGVEVVSEVRDPQKIAEERRAKELGERLLHACEMAAAFYEQQLLTAERSELARDAIAARGISLECAQKFRLGYAPAEWGALAEYFRSHKVSPSDAELAGLLQPRHTGGMYDRFRHRLMFPIYDRAGHVVGFSGRVLPVTEDIEEGIVPENAGKYINSPETPVYKKSDLLYGLQVARHAMVKDAEAILVEGNFDVVAMHQHGFSNTVCPLGTAFTDTQAKLLRRFAETVTIVFDADDAGQRAVRASHSACAKAGLMARVLTLPKDRAKDPDELLRAPGGAEFLRDALGSAKSLVGWLIDYAAAFAGDTVPERVAAFQPIAELLAEVREPIEQASYIEHAARVFVFSDRSIVERAVKSARNRPALAVRGGSRPANEGTGHASRGGSSGPATTHDAVEAGDERYEGDSRLARRPVSELAVRDVPFRRSAAKTVAEGDVSDDGAASAGLVSRATADGLDALLRFPQLLELAEVDELLARISATFARPLLETARRQWQTSGTLDGSALLGLCPNDRARTWLGERLIDLSEPEPTAMELAKKTVQDCVQRLKELQTRERARRLRKESARAEVVGDRDRAVALQFEAKQLLVGERLGREAGANSKRSAG